MVPFTADNCHDIRPPLNIKQASVRTLAKVMCSFLNTWRPCTIYYGITRECYVRGIRLSHDERDALRRGVDFMVGNLRPHLTSSSYGVDFVPVVISAGDFLDSANRYVIEIRVLGVHKTVYTTTEGECYLRQGSSTYLAITQDIRVWVVQQEEARYLAAKEQGADGCAATAGVSTGRVAMTGVATGISSTSVLRSWDKVVY